MFALEYGWFFVWTFVWVNAYPPNYCRKTIRMPEGISGPIRHSGFSSSEQVTWLVYMGLPSRGHSVVYRVRPRRLDDRARAWRSLDGWQPHTSHEYV